MAARAFVLVLLATTCAAQDVAHMEGVIQEHVKAGRFMGAVLVARGSDVILSKGYGSANLEYDDHSEASRRLRASAEWTRERHVRRHDDSIRRGRALLDDGKSRFRGNAGSLKGSRSAGLTSNQLVVEV